MKNGIKWYQLINYQESVGGKHGLVCIRAPPPCVLDLKTVLPMPIPIRCEVGVSLFFYDSNYL